MAGATIEPMRAQQIVSARGLLFLVAALTTLTACGTGRGVAAPPTPISTDVATSTSAGWAAPAGPLSRTDACTQFRSIVSQYAMTDEQSAAAFGALADQTEDAELAADLRRVADAFANHDQAVPDNDVLKDCDSA
jgi:hypothetical protein